MTARRTALMAHGSAELYGSDRVFLESVTALAEDGWDVVATVPAPGPLVAELERAGARVSVCPAPVLRKEALRPLGFARLLGLAKRSSGPMWHLLRVLDPDVVYVNTVTVPLWLAMARARRIPVVAHVHEAEDGVAKPVRLGLAAPLLAADRVVVNSRATAEVVRNSLRRLGGRITLVYNGVRGPASPASPAAAPKDPVRLVLVGRISPRKGTDVAVAALALLRARGHDVTLDLVGSVFPGWEWFERQVREAVLAAGCEAAVRWRGFRAEVWQSYSDADIALVPSRIEPFGNTAIEAQLAGVPVVVSDAHGLPETVEDGRWGPVTAAGDAASLADAIEDLLSDWAATATRADKAREVAAERFAPARYRDEIRAVVEAVAR
ncbi:glycosyltransferase family 4 protein [Amycolatopsis sp. CA-230715]|uniref:glycosyltransferase family 4 protein n=1 Tax=Amycolatopsis sp. CA-230715 TaxID=2745196 RepID=UPI001C3269F8|nr:glycosyltransferase family 4 protein [Amycolatopsis sp. CA-230715]QWF84182.1 D-inositol-3-phosphate glycosyltransferase [Amycolatopsis sp. CA-230715]